MPPALVAELRASRQFKWNASINSSESDIERRACFDEFRDLAQVFQLTVAARDRRVAELAHDDD